MDNPTANIFASSSALTSSASFHDVLGIAFAFGMLVYWIGAFIIMYHLIRFGVGNQPKKIAIVFLAGSLILSIITSLFLAQLIF